MSNDTRNFSLMDDEQQQREAVHQVGNVGRFGMLVDCNGPECLPYLFKMQSELSEWMLKVSREIALFESQRKAIEEGKNL